MRILRTIFTEERDRLVGNRSRGSEVGVACNLASGQPDLTHLASLEERREMVRSGALVAKQLECKQSLCPVIGEAVDLELFPRVEESAAERSCPTPTFVQRDQQT